MEDTIENIKQAMANRRVSFSDAATNTSEDRTEKSAKLCNYIYRNIPSHEATVDGPYGLIPVVYADYAATGQPLACFEDYIRRVVHPYYGNTHSRITTTAERTTSLRREAKDIIRNDVNCSEHDALIFTGNGATSCINKLNRMLSKEKPFVVFLSPFEHHSNILPWKQMDAKVVRIKEIENGVLDLHNLETELEKWENNENVQLIGSFSAASNVTGILTNVNAVATLLHKYGALAFFDYAEAGPYVAIDMNPNGPNEGLAYKDAVFISSHKFVGGIDGPGILVVKRNIVQNISEPGGGTVQFVSRETHKYHQDPEMSQEGGTPSIVGAIKAAMAFQLKKAVGYGAISKREKEICRMVFDKWTNFSELKLLGNISASRIPIFSFTVFHDKSNLYLHHNFVCAVLNDMFGIQSRSGCACAGPYTFDLLGISEPKALEFHQFLAESNSLDCQKEYSYEILRPGFVRISLPYFMPNCQIDFIIKSVAYIAEHGWRILPSYTFNIKSGEWKHKENKPLVWKGLGNISYDNGYFEIVEHIENATVKNQTEILAEAKNVVDNCVQEVLKKFTPDEQQFDADSSFLRWFLLPSEAERFIQAEEIGKKKPVFTIENRPHSHSSNTENQKVNTNFSDSKSQNNITSCHTHCLASKESL